MLSLSLLHLVLTNQLPESLRIINSEAISFFETETSLEGTRDIVLTNPPFIPIEQQPERIREAIVRFMQSDGKGRIDSSLAFLKMGVQSLKPGGYGLFVLPYAFLLGKHADGMRRMLSRECWIRCLVDLSSVEVFGDTGVYVVLLIFQKKTELSSVAPSATIVKCQDLVSQALQDVIEDKVADNDLYQIYRVSQNVFQKDTWITSPPALDAVNEKISRMPVLSDYVQVRQGIVSGQDKAFILSTKEAEGLDGALFRPFLADREMMTYTVPKFTNEVIFYPVVNGKRIKESELRTRYPSTWDYLNSQRDILSGRAPVRKGEIEWWELVRPRNSDEMFRRKIVTPHIVLTPRFGLDQNGEYAISRSYCLFPRDEAVEYDLVRYFLAVLNSTICFRLIVGHAHKYSRGYSVLEVGPLRKTPVPDPRGVPGEVMRELLGAVDARLSARGSEVIELERIIDRMVLSLYKLSHEDIEALGLGSVRDAY